jgi:hypothetical protein
MRFGLILILGFVVGWVYAGEPRAVAAQDAPSAQMAAH